MLDLICVCFCSLPPLLLGLSSPVWVSAAFRGVQSLAPSEEGARIGLDVALKGSFLKESPLRLWFPPVAQKSLCRGERLFSEISLSPLWLYLPQKNREGTLGCLEGVHA